ncbi:MAG: response regulator [Candidatus Omnitrophica bacterium]|nr:response regulator [Candidatus Omnitrophota bacterium]
MKKKILVVDDETYISLMVSGRLKANGFEVVTANDGQMGYEKTLAEKPDLVLLDIMMPGVDGYECLRMIKTNAETAAIPVMMLSAKAQQADLAKAREVGASGFITKPFKADEMLAQIREVLAV